MFRRFLKVSAFVLLGVGVSGSASAGFVEWDIDSAASFVRLTLPDQTIPVEGIGNVTARLRDAGSTSQWTDAGGRMAPLDGTIATNFAIGSSIEFLTGQSNTFALEIRNLRPDPNSFDPNNTNADNPDGQYSGTATAPAAFGARVRATYILTFDAAFLSFRDVLFDFDSGVIGLDGGGNYTGSQSDFGIASTLIDVDGLSLPLGLGQPIPDILGGSITDIVSLNTAGGSIADLGGDLYRLAYNINVPISVDIEGIVVTGSAAGQIVAYATVAVPEAGSLALMIVAAFGAGGVVWRRRRQA
jgi:hypothetical protein